MFRSAEFRAQIRADKFSPPQVDTPQFLYRKSLVDSLAQDGSSPSIIIEARAGQGKTTLIKQFLDRPGISSVWYQVGQEDADPAFFLQALLLCINKQLPDFPSNETAQFLEGVGFCQLDLPKQINLLLNDLDSRLKGNLYIVFDDLHYLMEHESGLFIVNYLLETAPPSLHFVLSSRETLALPSRQNSSHKRSLLSLVDEDLALSEAEITAFFQHVLQRDISHESIQSIARATDGWTMGVLLLGRQMEQQVASEHQLPLVCPGFSDRQTLLQYFSREILTTLELRLHRPLMVLSLLDEIPVELAIKLTGESNFGSDLSDLDRRNLFIRHLDSEKETFGFHHLFREFLQEKAGAELDFEEIRKVYHQAGDFYMELKKPIQALAYLLQSGDYPAVESALKEYGMSFLVTNQAVTLTRILNRVPQDHFNSYGWSSFYSALAHMDSAPDRALPLLSKALTVFSSHQDEVGELLSLAHIISIHITTTGHYKEGEELLKRAESLFFQCGEDLDSAMTILVARCLAMGYCIFLADVDESNKFASLALNLSRKEGLVNFEAAIHMIIGYNQIFAGHTALAYTCLESASSFLHRPEIGTFNCLSIRMMLFNFLFHEGDFKNYFKQKGQLVEAVGDTLFSQTIAGPFCYVWEMDIAINQGDFCKAMHIADRALHRQPPLSPHLSSQILQFKALVQALLHQADAALSTVEQSRKLRELSGGVYFVAQNKIAVGLVLSHCGRSEEAIELLSEAIFDARRMPTEYIEACATLHRASVYFELNAVQQAKQDIEAGLELMRRNSYHHFWAWTPEAMIKIFSFAARHDIENEYVQMLADERLGMAFSDDGQAIPLLSMKTLGDFKVQYRGEDLLQAEDFTPTQRELLCLLISAPRFKLPQETIQLHFWPDSPPEGAQTKFDTLVSRLRKVFTKVLPRGSEQSYLRREKGMLWLAHCKVDACEFLCSVDRGQRHLRLQEFWQAGNSFSTAESLWSGGFSPGTSGESQLSSFRRELTRTMTILACSWSELLVNAGHQSQAILVVEKALKNDPLDDRLYARLFQLQGQNSTIQARQVLTRFATVLQGEDYSADEIAELIAGISAN